MNAVDVDPAAEIAKLPAPIRERFDTPGGEREMRRALEDKALLIAEAKRQGFADSQDVREAVQALEDRLAVQAFLKAERAKLVISESDRRAYYDQHLSDFQLSERRVVRRHLCAIRGDRAAAEACAHNVLKQLKAGAPFDVLAKNGDGVERLQGGRLAPRQRGDFESQTAEVVFAASKGTVLGPIPSRDGFQVLRVEEILPPTTRPFEQVKADIDHRLEPSLERRAFERILSSLRTSGAR